MRKTDYETAAKPQNWEAEAKTKADLPSHIKKALRDHAAGNKQPPKKPDAP